MESALQPNKTYSFLQAGGEMGELILHHDWSRSSLGKMEHWSQSLRTTLANILHSAFPMFLFWGSDLTCFYNDAFRPSLGANGKHPAIGSNGHKVWPEIWEFIGPLINSVIETGKAVWFEDQLVPFYRNGKIEDIYWTFSYSPAFDDDGSINGVLVTCMETTENVLTRKKIEDTVSQRTAQLEKASQSLQQANSYLQVIINLFKEPLQVLEPVFENGEIIDFRYKLTNVIYASYANATPQELQGKRVGEVFPGYFQTSSFTKVAETFMNGEAATWEIHYDKDGLDLYNLMSATKLDREVVVHFTDFTKVKALQLQLERKIEELERSNQHLEEFAHAASHDLKEPIRKIHIFTSQLKDQLRSRLEEDELKSLERIENASKRMRQLVEDLLLYSYVSQNPHKKEPVDLNEVVKQVLEDLDLDIHEKNALVHIDTLLTVQGFRRQLQQLFQNLVSNALKYCKADESPRIYITGGTETVNDKMYHTIKVRDCGIGFDQQYADKIFQMFTRLHVQGKYEGTGVGLSIVKKIVENHDGLIKVESAAGIGSEFIILLPAE